jgi:hypothetical protein
MAKLVIKGEVVVTDYGSTFGTVFTPKSREKAAKLRKESPPYDTVSLVATFSQTLAFIDKTRLHPNIWEAFENGTVRILENIAFLRLPANEYARSVLGNNYINADNEFQSFIVADDDPLLSALVSLGHSPHYGVRSSNMTGQPEEFTIEGALEYANAIKSPVLAITHPEKVTDQHARKRVRSQPILHISQYSLEITLVRMGSTHPEALEIIIKHLFPQASFIQQEEKKVEYRTQYHPLDENIPLDAGSVRIALLTAAGILR